MSRTAGGIQQAQLLGARDPQKVRLLLRGRDVILHLLPQTRRHSAPGHTAAERILHQIAEGGGSAGEDRRPDDEIEQGGMDCAIDVVRPCQRVRDSETEQARHCEVRPGSREQVVTGRHQERRHQGHHRRKDDKIAKREQKAR